jgi:ADP-ribose pyrophosphatase YjhB (NUDIX family)
MAVYSDPGRDHVISIAYFVVSMSYDFRAGDDASDAKFVASGQREPLAFDHRKIIRTRY